MGIIYDFETGVKTEPPCECEDGVGISSNPFPWIKFIDTPEGGFARFQIDHETFIDKELSAERAMGLCTDLALIATKLLREEK